MDPSGATAVYTLTPAIDILPMAIGATFFFFFYPYWPMAAPKEPFN